MFRRDPTATPRLLARGKAKKLALIALLRKLIILANRLLKCPDFILAS